jgi:hypothetical protein
MLLDLCGQSKEAEQSLFEGAKTASWRTSLPWPFLSKVPCSSLYCPVRGAFLKLVSRLLQVALYSMELVWGSRAKPSLVIDKDDLRVLKMHDHIWSMIAIDIHKAECHRDQIGIGPIQLRAEIDAGLRAIATGKLDHLDTTIQI